MNFRTTLAPIFRKQLPALSAVVMIALLLAGFLFFTLRVIVPQRELRTGLQERKETAVSLLAGLPPTLPPLNGSSSDLEAARRQLEQAASPFLTENEAAAVLNLLSVYAADEGVAIVELQVLPVADTAPKLVYDQRHFQVWVEGDVPNLLAFLARVRETAASSVQISDLALFEASSTDNLTFSLTLYTSPYAGETALLDLPDLPTPLPVPTAVSGQQPVTDTLSAQLDQAWQEEAWPAAISVIQELLKRDPNDLVMLEKLYAAYVNYGYQLQSQGNVDGAQEQFTQALTVNPNGAEANQALAALKNAPP